jgi:hypothetical protein
MESLQVQQLNTYRDRLSTVYNDTLNEMSKLDNIIHRLTNEGMKV